MKTVVLELRSLEETLADLAERMESGEADERERISSTRSPPPEARSSAPVVSPVGGIGLKKWKTWRFLRILEKPPAGE